MTGRRRDAEPAEPTPDEYRDRLEQEPAQIGYEAYVRSCGGRSVRGEALPSWLGQRPDVQRHWREAAEAIERHVLGLSDGQPLRFGGGGDERESDDG